MHTISVKDIFAEINFEKLKEIISLRFFVVGNGTFKNVLQRYDFQKQLWISQDSSTLKSGIVSKIWLCQKIISHYLFLRILFHMNIFKILIFLVRVQWVYHDKSKSIIIVPFNKLTLQYNFMNTNPILFPQLWQKAQSTPSLSYLITTKVTDKKYSVRKLR